MSGAYNIVVQTLKLVDDDEGYPDYAEVIKTEYTGGDWQETKAALEDIYNKNVKAFEEFAEVDSKLAPAYDKYHKALRKYNDYEKMAKKLSDTIDSIPRVSDIDGKAVLASTEAESKKLQKEVYKLGKELQKIKDDHNSKYDILEDISQDGIYGLATPGNMKANYESFQDWLNSNEGSQSLVNYLEDNGWHKVEPTGLEVNEVDPWDY